MDAIEGMRETLDKLEQIEINYLLTAYEGYPPPKVEGELQGVSKIPPKGTFKESELKIKNKLAHIELHAMRCILNAHSMQLRVIAARYARRLHEIEPGEPHECPACGLEIYGGRKGRCCRKDENEECYNERQAERKRRERAV